MIQYHPDIELMSGTSWIINGTLTDASGAVFDPSQSTLEFALLDPEGNALTLAGVNISVTNPVTGSIQILVPNTATALVPDRYTDALQVTGGPIVDLFWIGSILIAANPLNIVNGITEQDYAPPPAPTAPLATNWDWMQTVIGAFGWPDYGDYGDF